MTANSRGARGARCRNALVGLALVLLATLAGAAFADSVALFGEGRGSV